MTRLVKLGDAYVNPREVALITQAGGGFACTVELRNGTRLHVADMTPREAVDALLPPVHYTAADL